MQENKILTEAICEFLKATDKDCERAENVVSSFLRFYEFVEDNENLKDVMYEFFYKLFDDFILFKFYTSPIPALEDSETYMEKYRADVQKQADTFFNFGGFEE
jgi:hypothetical protein